LWHIFWCHSRSIWSLCTCIAYSFAFKISMLCWIFRFLRLGVVSLPCEWSWAIRLFAASVVAPYYSRSPLWSSCKCCFWRTILKMEYPELSLISFVEPTEKYFVFEPRSRAKSQLITLRCKNKKNRHKNEI
jgi:hypothetical protein